MSTKDRPPILWPVTDNHDGSGQEWETCGVAAKHGSCGNVVKDRRSQAVHWSSDVLDMVYAKPGFPEPVALFASCYELVDYDWGKIGFPAG